MPINGVRIYNGRAFSSRMLSFLDVGTLSTGEFCRAVCTDKIKSHEIRDFPEVLA